MKKLNSTRPDESYTLADYIREGSNSEVSFGNITIVKPEKYNGVLFPISDIFMRYRDIIDAYVIEVKLTTDEREKYLYNPSLLSFDIYKTTELWCLLMFINNAVNFSKFRFTDKVKIFDPNQLDVINRILNNEQSTIDKNRIENRI